MFSQNVEIFCFTFHLCTWYDMDLYLVSFGCLAPPCSAPGLFTIPKERNLARIKARWHVTHSCPVIYGRIVLVEGLNCWENRIELRQCIAYPVTSAPTVDLFVSSPRPGVLRTPIVRKSQIIIKVPQKYISI